MPYGYNRYIVKNNIRFLTVSNLLDYIESYRHPTSISITINPYPTNAKIQPVFVVGHNLL